MSGKGTVAKVARLNTKVTTRGSLGKDKSTPEYQEYKKYLNRVGSCDIGKILLTMKTNNNIIKGKDIDDLINGFTTMKINMGGDGNMSGGGIAIPLGSSYLTAIVKKLEEGGEAVNAVYDQLYIVLEKGLELLQFLSNKNSCLEKFLKYLVGDNITKLIEYYIIGTIAMSTDLLEFVNVLRSILIMIKPIIIPIIGGTVSIFIGKYVSAITSYYVKKGQGDAVVKARKLQTKLDKFVNMSDKEAVENIKNAADDLHTLIIEEMKSMPIMDEDGKNDFMDEVEAGLTQEQEDLLTKVGELHKAQSVKERFKMRQQQKINKAAMQVVGDNEILGGKRHRKTKKHHKKSQKKYRKKSHKRHHKKK